MRYQVTIDRWTGAEKCTKENWKDLISSLVLCGFEVYGDDDKIVFDTGKDEIVKIIENNKK